MLFLYVRVTIALACERSRRANEVVNERGTREKNTRVVLFVTARSQALELDLGPSWDRMYEKLEAHKADTGTLDVNEEDDEELCAWTKIQRRNLVLHFQGKNTALSNEQVAKLKSLGYDQSRPGVQRARGIIDASSAEEKWNETPRFFQENTVEDLK